MFRLGKDSNVESIITAIASAVLIIVALGVPLTHFAVLYKIEQSALATLVQSKARNFSEQNVARRPDMWQFESHVLKRAVRVDLGQTPHEYRYTILDATGKTLALGNDNAPDSPIITESAVIHDSGVAVGMLRAEKSIRGALQTALASAIICALLGGGLFVAIRTYPLRALQRSRQQLIHMAHHDALTGLPNRSLLVDRLEQAILHCRRYGRQVTLVYLDLDNFKDINDSLGHAAGDELLCAQAARMRECVRNADTVARLGGDEFVIILFERQENRESILHIIQRLQAAISLPLTVKGRTVKVTPSIGAASYPSDGADAQTLLMNADSAMYAAKAAGRNGFHFFTTELNHQAHERLELQQALANAITEDQLLLHYQPKVDVATGKISGVEALIRWQHPQWGLVPPVRFIPIAEESGMIVDIGKWVLHSACRQGKQWLDAGLPPMVIAVNVSAVQFREKNLAASVQEALQETGFPAQYLELELTESMIMQNVEQTLAIMTTLEQMQVRLSIDDFGTGYSSLSTLKQFPVCRLKIDRSFVRDLEIDENDKSITRAVIALAHSLNLSVVAEGVETQGQLEFLRELNCDEVQGYLFSKPVLPAEIPKKLRAAQATMHPATNEAQRQPAFPDMPVGKAA